MANINEEARIPVYLNDEQAVAAMKNLQNEADKWRRKMHEAMAGGDMKGMKTAEREMKKATTAANKLKKEAFDVNKVLNSLSSASIDDMARAYREVRKQQKGLKRDTKEYQDLQKKKLFIKSELQKVNGTITTQQGLLNKLKFAASGLLPAFGIGTVVFGIGRISKSLFDLTSQIQGETIRSTTVLGDQLGYVENQADKLAEKMGVTNREFVSMVANTGDLLIPLDFTREKAAQMATQVQSLSGALDEWTAGKYGVAQVSEILTKAMLGEMEQLKGLGIAIRQDSEEFRNLVKQKKETENATDAQARAMATLELLYKKSADAQAAYQLEGNKLLRTQKSINLSFRSFKESIATSFSDGMKSATEKLRDQQRIVGGLDNNLVPLIEKYEKLSTKSIPLTAEEQQELNLLMGQIGDIAPLAITGIDEYGKILGISTEKAKEYIETQKAMLRVRNADAIAEQTENLNELQRQFDKVTTKIANGFEVVSVAGEVYDQAIDNERLGELNSQLLDLGNSIKGTEAYIKTLSGEKIIDIETTNEETEANKSLIETQEKLLEDAKKMPETTEAEIAAKNKKIEVIEKEIERLKELGLEKNQVYKVNAEVEIDTSEDIDIKAVEKDMKPDVEFLNQQQQNEINFTKFLIKQIELRNQARKQGLELEKEISDARIALKDLQVNAMGQLAGSMASMFEQGSLMQKGMIAIEKAFAIAQIWMNLAKEKSAIRLAAANIMSQPWPGARLAGTAWGMAMTGKAIAAAKINTGLVLAQTVASSVSAGKRKKTQAYAQGKYPGIQTGTYGDRPHYALFNEVPGYPEMVVDGKTFKTMQMDYPGLIQAIYNIRDGKQPGGYATGKYPESNNPTQPYTDPEIKALLIATIKSNEANEKAANRLYENGTYVSLTGKNGFYETDAEFQAMKNDVTLQ